MLRPHAFHEAKVALQDIPYAVKEESSKAPSPGGIVERGTIVWTQEAEPSRANEQVTTAFVDGIGLVSLNPRSLIRADVLNERETKHRDIPHSSPPAVEPVVFRPTHEEVERLAYSFWEKRGCGEGGAEQDWIKAEQELRALGPLPR